MIVVCAWCKKWLEEIEPLDDESLTHGICKDCQRKQLAEVEKMRRKNPKWDVGERVQFRKTRKRIMLPAHRHLNAGIGSALWGGAKAGYYTYRAGRLEGKAKRYQERAAGAMRNPRTIPGSALEVRYRRATDGKLYYHPFEGPVKMVANADGSVTFRGGKRLWADDREAGFWERYGHPKRRRNPSMARRRGRRKDNTMLWVLGAVGAFMFWPQISQALGLAPGTVSTGGQSIIPQGSSAVWYSDPYQGGGGEFFVGSLPPGAAPPWRLASATEIGVMESGLLAGSLAQAGGGLVAPAAGFLT